MTEEETINHAYVVTQHSPDSSEVLFVCNSLLKSKFLLKHKIHQLFSWISATDIDMADDGVSLFDNYRFEITKWKIEK